MTVLYSVSLEKRRRSSPREEEAELSAYSWVGPSGSVIPGKRANSHMGKHPHAGQCTGVGIRHSGRGEEAEGRDGPLFVLSTLGAMWRL